jgi:predicted lipoprotein with Yx(FWY)xxD motif
MKFAFNTKSSKAASLLSALILSAASSMAAAGELVNVNEVKVGEVETLLLTDSFRRTLYVFDPDIGTGKSTCNLKCSETWPPLTVTAAEAASLKNPRLTTLPRDTGLVQLQFDGRPVYTFNQDRTPGDIKGNGLGGVWHVIPFAATSLGMGVERSAVQNYDRRK